MSCTKNIEIRMNRIELMIPHFPQYTKYTHVMIRFKLKPMPEKRTSRSVFVRECVMWMCLRKQENDWPNVVTGDEDWSRERGRRELHQTTSRITPYNVSQIYVLILE